MTKISIHQPNLCPWYPFFYKMAMSDKFIILSNVQFEKNGFQNRYKLSNGKWVTKSVKQGKQTIWDKHYADGTGLYEFNMQWIYTMAWTLNIDTCIVNDFEIPETGKTERLIKLIKHFGGDTYITNSEAKDKYLDEDLMRSNGIEIEYCRVPKHLQKHTFEIFEEYGIDGAIKQLPKRSK